MIKRLIPLDVQPVPTITVPHEVIVIDDDDEPEEISDTSDMEEEDCQAQLLKDKQEFEELMREPYFRAQFIAPDPATVRAEWGKPRRPIIIIPNKKIVRATTTVQTTVTTVQEETVKPIEHNKPVVSHIENKKRHHFRPKPYKPFWKRHCYYKARPRNH